MTLTSGIESGKLQDPPELKKSRPSQVLLKASPLRFSIDFEITGERKIRGRAHTPEVDRENELILLKAFEATLPKFMKAPIMHEQHTERPVGIFTKVALTDGLDIEGEIFEHCDDVWERVKKGEYNRFSIYGQRRIGSPECSLQPAQRITPCITKALDLYSISLVGENAINEGTWLELVKSFSDYYKNEHILIKAENTDSSLIHVVTDGDKELPFGEYKDFAACEAANKNKGDPGAYCASIEHQITGKWPAEKAAEPDNMDLVHDPKNLSNIMERLDNLDNMAARVTELEKCYQTMKGETMTETEDKKEEVEKCSDTEKKAEEVPKVPETVEKAVVPADPEVISKADVEGLISKAITEKFGTIEKSITELTASVDEIKKQKIEKGGNVVVITQELKPEEKNELLKNSAALGGI